VEARGYQCTAVRGAESVLLLDPLAGGRISEVLAAVESALKLPVSAFAYSHHHGDHISDASDLLEQLDASSRPISVYGTVACAQAVHERGRYPVPDVILPNTGGFNFEDVPIQVEVIGGHTADNTCYQLPEGVVHCVDLVHPGQAEFDSFGLTHSVHDYERALRRLLDLPWRVMTAGHGQIGWRADVQTVLRYLTDVQHAVTDALTVVPARPSPTDKTSYPEIAHRLSEVTEICRSELATCWSELPGFADVVDSHIRVAFMDLVYLR
jgi:glyoxylase-like metal-dependent hydrolase (beta-lactamase superfamily II)